LVVGCEPDFYGWNLDGARDYVRWKGLESKVLLVCADGTTLPFASETFDIAVMNDVCDHIKELDRALGECYRILQPGGQVLITFIPWYHPGGFHLIDYIPIPYAHLLFDEAVLIELLLGLAAENPKVADSLPGLKRNPPPESLDELGLILSRVTIHKFERIVACVPFRVRLFRLAGFGPRVGNPVLRGILDIGLHIPLLREIVTSRIDCILEKP